jgi:uncharacterized Rossmann fold enzyme
LFAEVAVTDPMVDYESEFMRHARHPLEAFRNACKDETVVCLGAGASLRKQRPERLERANVLACNSAWRWMTSRPLGVVITDSRRLSEEAPLIAATEPPMAVFCSPSNYALTKVSTTWANAARSLFGLVPMRGGGPDGNPFDPTAKGLNSQGGSVIFHAITLAAFMGAKRIVLLGCDFDYSQNPAWWYDHDVLPKWLGLGDFADRALEAMRMYARAYERRGIELVNATEGGKIDCLPRVKYEEMFK